MNRTKNGKVNAAQPINPFTYAQGKTPEGYECDICASQGVKLWRDSHEPLYRSRLLCLACSCADQGEPLYRPTEDGLAFYTGKVSHWYRTDDMVFPDGSPRWDGYDPDEPQWTSTVYLDKTQDATDQIMSLLPAVPTEDGTNVWAYTMVPDDGVAWWAALPVQEPR